VNVTIVGAGLIGCSLAHELATRHVKVRVIDPRGAGRGATHASAGILAPWIEGHSAPLLRLLRCSLQLYDEFIRRMEDEAGPVEYERSGTLQVALDADSETELRAVASQLAQHGVAHEWLSRREVLRREPALSSDVRAGVRLPGQGYVAVPALVGAIVTAATARGVAFERDRVTAVRSGRDGAEVVTPGATHRCDAAVVAAGTWSSDLADATLRPAPIRPIRGQLLRLRVPTRPAGQVIWGRRCYLVPWQDGTVLAGATVEDVGYDERTTAAGVRELLDAATELMPALGAATFEEARAGLRPATHDELPVMGRSSISPRVFFATGHFRNGVLLAPLTASMLADLVADGREREELALTDPARVGL
jgi:glycine oxidase